MTQPSELPKQAGGPRLETGDPLRALAAPDIPTRAAAARDLSLVGTPEVIPLLVRMAQDDRSPAVRLGTAGAAADILSRARVGPARDALSLEERVGLLDLFRGIDPGVNSGLFSMLACLGLPEAFRRITVGLRDPRGGVRVGAAAGLLRLCTSADALGDAELERHVVELLYDTRLKPDAIAEVARVCAAAGYRTGRPVVEELELTGAHGELVALALRYYEAADAPLRGAWLSDGRDAGEVNPAPALPPALLVGVEGGALVREGTGSWRFDGGLFERLHRRMFLRRAGQHVWGPAFQEGCRTWYAAGDDALLEAVDGMVDPAALDWGHLAPVSDHAERLAQAVIPRLGEGGPALRAKALLHAAAGQAEEAVAAVRAAAEQKKVPPDVWFFLGEVSAARGEVGAAREHWEAAVKKARRKRDWYALRARERLDS